MTTNVTTPLAGTGARTLDPVQLYRTMVMARTLNDTLKARKTQGRVPFYIGCAGHESVAAMVAALEVDDSDRHGLEALGRLYARTERWRDLADLTRRRAEQSALPEDEAKHRIQLGPVEVHQSVGLGPDGAGSRARHFDLKDAIAAVRE